MANPSPLHDPAGRHGNGSGGVIAYLDAHDLSGLAVVADGSVLVTDDLAGVEIVTEVSVHVAAVVAHSTS